MEKRGEEDGCGVRGKVGDGKNGASGKRGEVGKFGTGGVTENAATRQFKLREK
jgi:hypothetical protein